LVGKLTTTFTIWSPRRLGCEGRERGDEEVKKEKEKDRNKSRRGRKGGREGREGRKEQQKA